MKTTEDKAREALMADVKDLVDAGYSELQAIKKIVADQVAELMEDGYTEEQARKLLERAKTDKAAQDLLYLRECAKLCSNTPLKTRIKFMTEVMQEIMRPKFN
jgi:hypothetical protein